MATPRKKTPNEMALTTAIKVQRASTRLKYSIQADYELNEKIYEIIDGFTELEQAGKSIQISTDFGGEGVVIKAGKKSNNRAVEE